jgi:urease accessory protein
MRTSDQRGAATILACLALPVVALAHTGHGSVSASQGGLAAGLLHPLSGLDHVLAMLAVGMWAAQIGGRAVWIVPSAFVGMMLVGAARGAQHAALPLVEIGIAASVVVLGLALAGAVRVPTAVAAMAVGLFAILHGHSHGTEAAGLSGVGYGVGLSLATACLHGAGIALARSLRTLAPRLALRYAGGAVAADGVMLCAGVLFDVH